MFSRVYFLALLTLLGQAFPAPAQILTPTTLTAALSQPTGKVGTELDLVITAKIQSGWHLYSTDFSDEAGPAVFTLTFTKSPAYALVGKPRSVGSKHAHDEVFNGEVAYFEKTGQIRQRIKLLQAGRLTIQAIADYQSCSEADGRCVPGSSALTFGPLRVATKAVAAVAPTAKPMPSAAAGGTSMVSGPTETAIQPQPAANPVAAAPAAPAATPATQMSASAPVAPVALASAASAPAAPATAATAMVVPAGTSLWRFGLLAFLAGLAALLTPCVFPMVPLTVSLFTGNDDSRGRGILKALVYGASIIAIYTVVGVGVARLLGAEGPNFLATHWLPNLVFFVVFVAFGLSFLGLFEITLPSGLVNRADRQADQGGWGGIFFAAFTLVLVSFSCTGPIVATVLSLSAQGETLLPVVGMLGFSLAFALPFTLFAIFPAWLKSLPRAGGWLNMVKVTLGFVELMLALKFLSTVDLTYHWQLLDRGLYLTLWIALSLMLGLYLLGKFRLAHDADLPHLSVGRVLVATGALGFALCLVPGLFGAPLPLLAGYLPPPTSRDFSLAAAPVGTNSSAAMPVLATSQANEKPRFGDFLELPLGLTGYFGLASLAFIPHLRTGEPKVRSTAGPAPRNLTGLAVATFAGGCFWSHEETFEEVRGVTAVIPGYSGGKEVNPTYEQVASQTTGHAEAVQMYYNPQQVSYQQLLDVFFLGAHNPTELNRQGPDEGPEYRSVAFYRTPQERQLIEATIRRIDAAHRYSTPIVTQVTAFNRFWAAEAYHHGYYRLHPSQGYITRVSQPKLEHFRAAFPQLLKPLAQR